MPLLFPISFLDRALKASLLQGRMVRICLISAIEWKFFKKPFFQIYPTKNNFLFKCMFGLEYYTRYIVLAKFFLNGSGLSRSVACHI